MITIKATRTYQRSFMNDDEIKDYINKEVLDPIGAKPVEATGDLTPEQVEEMNEQAETNFWTYYEDLKDEGLEYPPTTAQHLIMMLKDDISHCSIEFSDFFEDDDNVSNEWGLYI